MRGFGAASIFRGSVGQICEGFVVRGFVEVGIGEEGRAGGLSEW